MAAVIASCLAFSVPLSKVSVLLALLGRTLNRFVTALYVASAVLASSFVSKRYLLLRSTRELRATRLFLDTRLSPSQWPNRVRFSTECGLWSIGTLLGILVLRSLSAYALVPSLTVCPPEALYKLLTVFGVGMIDVLVN